MRDDKDAEGAEPADVAAEMARIARQIDRLQRRSVDCAREIARLARESARLAERMARGESWVARSREAKAIARRREAARRVERADAEAGGSLSERFERVVISMGRDGIRVTPEAVRAAYAHYFGRALSAALAAAYLRRMMLAGLLERRRRGLYAWREGELARILRQQPAPSAAAPPEASKTS